MIAPRRRASRAPRSIATGERSLPRLAGRFEHATGLTVHQDLPGTLPPLPDTHRLALFRAAQEGLTNVEKHAAASQAWLVLAVGRDAITLQVADDGTGLPPGTSETGFGLQGLRERARQLGGELHVGPRDGGGTQLTFRLPLACEDEHG